MKIITHSEAETNHLAADFAKTVKPGAVVALYGPLGSGKTTFIKGLARGLGISERIVSPTFVLMRSYQLPGKAGYFYHLDLYRLESLKELKSLDLNELIREGTHVIAVEWAEKAEKVLPKNAIKIHFKSLKSTERSVTIQE